LENIAEMQAAAAGGGGGGAGAGAGDRWDERLPGLIEAQPLPQSIPEAIETLDQVGVNVAAVQEAANRLERKIPAERSLTDWRHTHPDFPLLYALAMHIYTLQDPNVYTQLNMAMYDTLNRGSGPDGVSQNLRACLPFIKLLDEALKEAAIVFGFFAGQVFRGVRHAFPSPDAHDPVAHFPVGRELQWFQFCSSSTKFGVMYHPWFCGKSGPRTVFTIQSCEGVSVKPFSAMPDEEEVLFRPLARFRVTSSAKKLTPADLVLNPPANGGFPDDVALTQLQTFDAMVELRARSSQMQQAQAIQDNEAARQDVEAKKRLLLHHVNVARVLAAGVDPVAGTLSKRGGKHKDKWQDRFVQLSIRRGLKWSSGWSLLDIASDPQRLSPAQIVRVYKCVDDVNGFEVVSLAKGGKTYKFKTESDTNRDTWVQGIQDCIAEYNRFSAQTVEARRQPLWIPDADAPACMLCDADFVKFPLSNRHHCRYCGFAVCGSCSAETAVLDRWLADDKPHGLQIRRSAEPLRVCDACFRFFLDPE